MQEPFIEVFIAAFIFTLYAFFIMEDDLEKQSVRPIFILIIAIVAWFVSVPMLVQPYNTTTTSTTSYGAYNTITYNSVVETSANVINLQEYATHTASTQQVSMTNQPFPVYTFLEYGAVAWGMDYILILFLIQYMLGMGARTIRDAIYMATGHKLP